MKEEKKDIKIVKLVSGETFVCFLKKEKSQYVVRKPLLIQVVPNIRQNSQTGTSATPESPGFVVALAPYVLYCKGEQFVLSPSNVMFVQEPTEDVRDTFWRLRNPSPILHPPNSGKLVDISGKPLDTTTADSPVESVSEEAKVIPITMPPTEDFGSEGD